MGFLPSPYGLDQQSNPADPLGSALSAAPGLVNQPGLAQVAAQAPDPSQAAQVMSHAQYVSALSDAINTSVQKGPAHQGFLGSLMHAATSIPGVSTALSWAAKPIHAVQSDYKFIHSVYVKHGFWNGALATLGTVGGAVAGAELGPVGAMLGADAGGFLSKELLGNSVYQDSLQQANDPNYKVSIGRDIANAVGAGGQTDSGWGKYVSGVADAVFDFKADPLVLAGKLKGAARLGQIGTAPTGRLAQAYNKLLTAGTDLNNPELYKFALARGLTRDVIENGQKVGTEIIPGTIGGLTARSQAARNFLDQISPGQKIAEASQVADAFNSLGGHNQFQRVAKQIVNWNAAAPTRSAAAGRIIDNLPGQQGLAWELSGAKTPEDVLALYQRATHDEELFKRITLGTLPGRSLGRTFGAKIAESVRGIGSDGTVAGTGVKASAVTAADGTQLAPAITTDGSKLGVLGRTVKTFTGYRPFAIDNGTLQLSRVKFDPTDPASLQGVLRSMRFSMGNDLAREYAGRMAAAASSGDSGLAKSIWAESQVEMLKAAGVGSDTALMQRIAEQSRQIIHGPEDTQFYGHGAERGAEVGSAPITGASDGQVVEGTAPQALDEGQRGFLSYPDYTEVREAMRATRNPALKGPGALNDWLATKVTNSIFKPLALLNAGFGLRVAAAEAIPASMRYGAMNMLRTKVADIAAKQNFKLAAQGDEAGHIISAAARASGGIQRLIGDPEMAKVAIGLVQDFNGHIVSGVSSTGHNSYVLSELPADRQQAVLDHLFGRGYGRITLHDTGDYRLFSDPHDPLFQERWLTELQKKSQLEPYRAIARDVQSGLPTDQLVANEARRIGNGVYPSEQKILSRYHNQTPEQFAADRVDAFRGLVTGRDGTLHSDLVDKVASAEKPTIEDLASKAPESAPTAVIGQKVAPYMGTNLRERIVAEGFKKVVDPIINNLSREPIFTNAVLEEQRALRPLLESGKIDDEMFRHLSYRRATHAILPQIHNPALKSQFAELASNFLPFYFAQEQAWKRYAHVAYANPAAFREYQVINQGLHDPGFVQADSQGNRYLNIPLVGEFGQALQGGAHAIGVPMVAALPMQFSGNLDSLKTVLPEASLPGVGPIGALSLKAVEHYFPEAAGTIANVEGDQAHNATLFDQMIPNAFLRNSVKALTGTGTSFHAAYMSSLAAAHFHGLDVKVENGVEVPYSQWTPAEQQAYLDRVRNNAKSILFTKSLLNLFSPLSPKVDIGDVNKATKESLRDEFFRLQTPKAQGGLGMTYQDALANFLKEHGDKAISYTVAQSQNLSGAQFPDSQAALDFLNNNKSLIGQFSGAAAYLIPQSRKAGDNASLVHNEIIKQGLRAQRTPDEFMSAVYEQAGNQQYYAAKAAHDAAVLQLGNNKPAVEAERQNWDSFKTQFSLANPLWADAFNSPVRQQRAARLLKGLQDMFAAGATGQVSVPLGPQTTAVQTLLNDWRAHQLSLAQIGADRSSSHQRQLEQDNWQSYLEAKATSNPELSGPIRSIFLPLNAADAAYLARTEVNVGNAAQA